jgi:hypothetical protein
MGAIRNSQNVLITKLEEKRPLGKITRRWEGSRVWTGSMWIRVGVSGGLASQEGLYSLELVVRIYYSGKKYIFRCKTMQSFVSHLVNFIRFNTCEDETLHF